MESVDDRANDDDGYTVGSDEKQDETGEKMAWHFLDLQDYYRQGTSALQAIRIPFRKYNVKEPADFVGPQTIITDHPSPILRIVGPTYQLFETRDHCLTHRKDHETEAPRLNDLTSQRLLLPQNNADTYEDVSGVSLLCLPFIVVGQAFCIISEERDEYRAK